jgi:hypothetical protein
MGYELHITRREDWPDDGPSISFDEWMAVVNADPELRLGGYVDRRLADGSVFCQPLAVWIAHPRIGESDGMGVFDLAHGTVRAKKIRTARFAAKCGDLRKSSTRRCRAMTANSTTASATRRLVRRPRKAIGSRLSAVLVSK